jgi:hypothetical protein
MWEHIKEHVSPLVSRLNNTIRPYNEKVWVVGDGRSGTNWLSSIINFDGDSRFVYEPIHPEKVTAMKRLHLFEYQRPDQENAALYALVKLVMTGTLSDARANHNNRLRLYSRLLVKDSVKTVLIMRHPFDVAASKSRKQNWAWMKEPRVFLKQPDLVEDHLKPFQSFIENQQSFFEKQITIWAIIHYVWLRQFKEGGCHIVFYENLCRNTAVEVSRLGKFIGRPSGTVENMTRFAVSSVKNEPVQNQLWPQFSGEEKKRGHEILTTFGLGNIYGAKRTPLIGTDSFFNS